MAVLLHKRAANAPLQYVCTDGTAASNPNSCPTQHCTLTGTCRCADGSVAKWARQFANLPARSHDVLGWQRKARGRLVPETTGVENRTLTSALMGQNRTSKGKCGDVCSNRNCRSSCYCPDGSPAGPRTTLRSRHCLSTMLGRQPHARGRQIVLSRCSRFAPTAPRLTLKKVALSHSQHAQTDKSTRLATRVLARRTLPATLE